MLIKQGLSVVFIANTGRDDPPLPEYLMEALLRFEREGQARYKLNAHDLEVSTTGTGMGVSSQKLKLSGLGKSVQFALLDMFGTHDPGAY